MRAISPIANYGITLVHPTTKRGPDSSGTIVEWSDGELVHAQFHRGGLTEWEQIIALEMFDFSGLPEGVNPLTRVSCFDTEGYVQNLPPGEERDRFQAKIEERLEHFAKLFPSEFVIVAKPASPIPWRAYDTTPLQDTIEDNGRITLGLLSMLEQSGTDPQEVRLYEVENADRPEVVAQMEALEALIAGGLTLNEAVDKLRSEDDGEVAVSEEAISVEV